MTARSPEIAPRRAIIDAPLAPAAPPPLGDGTDWLRALDWRAFERLIAEKIAERTDVVSADYLTQLILLASDGMIVQEALRNDNFDAAAFVRQSEAYLRALRPAGRI